MGDKKKERDARLAKALRENLKRRKVGREILPGTGRGTATRSGVVEGASGEAEGPLHHPSPSATAGPPPRSGED